MRATSAVQREIRQGRPFAGREQEAVVGLLRTADVLRQRLAGVVEPHGVTLQQFNVLRILRGAGAAGLPTLEIALRMVERAPGITRLLDRLEAKRLVTRKRCPRDRRQVLCWISRDGLELLAKLDRPMQQGNGIALGGLSGRDLRSLVRLLDAVRASRSRRSRRAP